MKSFDECVFYFENWKVNRKKLFEEAIACSKHGKVLYIMKEEPNELPQLSQDLGSVDRHYMKMISFLYAKNLESLIESIASLPNWQNVPSTIILEDLALYCESDKIQNACGVVAFLIDTMRVCEVSLKVPCKLFISVTKDSVGDTYCNALKELYCLKL